MFRDKSLDMRTQKSLNSAPFQPTAGFQATKIWFSSEPLLLRKLIRFCAHFLRFNFIPRRQENPDVSFITIGYKHGEYLGNASRAEVSSTNLTLQCQSLS